MEIRIRNDSVEIEGYVNAVERKSKPMSSRVGGKFVEIVKKGAFQRAINRNDNVHILLNHNWERDLGSTKNGSLKLNEDSIGLKARATITDPEVIKKARNGDLVGWSFGFTDRDGGVDVSEENGMTVRSVSELNLYEVSILDRRRSPAYDGTLITVRNDENIFNSVPFVTDVQIREDEEPENEPNEGNKPDYSEAERIIAKMKGEKNEQERA